MKKKKKTAWSFSNWYFLIQYQGRNELCGIKYQRGGIRDQKGGIRVHKPWDRDQQFFFREQGVGCIIFVGSGTKICHAVGIKDRKFGYKNGISDKKKNISLYDPAYLFCGIRDQNLLKDMLLDLRIRDLGTKMGSVMKKQIYLATTLQYAVNQLKCFRKDHPKGLLIYFWS